ncbi:hypothetical protein [Micromonospora arida]|uniref:hypothetical protein n=1 Tax=Micromonospora arida TaxID=2203715 RepID=UPI000F6034B4|nr:hypothetical protein [Micromonospora arida]
MSGRFRERVRLVKAAVFVDLDLYALLLAGFIFTILGATGVADVKTLSSVVLALLSLMAFSQIRTRRVQAGPATHPYDNLFLADFPPALYEHRDSVSQDWLYIGVSGYRTIGAGRLPISKVLQRNAKVRILLLDHRREDLLRAAAARSASGATPERLRERILASLSELAVLVARFPGNLEIRLLPFLTTVGVNAFDTTGPNGRVYVQHYEYATQGESSPIYTLRASDGYWYQHQLAEFERMWDEGRPA